LQVYCGPCEPCYWLMKPGRHEIRMIEGVTRVWAGAGLLVIVVAIAVVLQLVYAATLAAILAGISGLGVGLLLLERLRRNGWRG
jgi:hypothetical protein